MCRYICTEFQVSSIILRGFRQGGGNFTPRPTSKRTPKKPTQIRVKGVQTGGNEIFLNRHHPSYQNTSAFKTIRSF